MLNLNEFINEKRIEKQDTEIQVQDPDNPKKTISTKQADAEISRIKGKKLKSNGTEGKYTIESPYDGDALKKAEARAKVSMADDRNLKRLSTKIKLEQPFMIIGEAGWGKTSVIKDLAKQNNLHVIVVYLDKAEAYDLGGLPYIHTLENGTVTQMNAMPIWAYYIYSNPDKKFLLFFDELNQADSAVCKALMPIVNPDQHEICGIKMDNYIVGAAGNTQDEDRTLTTLSKPLLSRFKPIIYWNVGDEANWKTAFNFLRSKWDGIIDSKVIDELAKHVIHLKRVFSNPREIDQHILGIISRVKSNPEKFENEFDADMLKEYVYSACKNNREDLKTAEQEEVDSLIDYLYAWITSSKVYSSVELTSDILSDDEKKWIQDIITKGYFKVTSDDGQKVNIVVSEDDDDLADLCTKLAEDNSRVGREVVDSYIRELRAIDPKKYKEFKFKNKREAQNFANSQLVGGKINFVHISDCLD